MKAFDLNFYKNKRVFITGHTGFKGSWLCKLLANAGASVFWICIRTTDTSGTL